MHQSRGLPALSIVEGLLGLSLLLPILSLVEGLTAEGRLRA